MSTALAFTAETTAASERARRRINLMLDGPVLAILTDVVPDLVGYPKARRLEIVLNDCSLLHRCFLAFRQERRRFRTLLVDRRDRPVDNDNAPLACGRSLNQVIAMIVRSAAKRHFRMRLDRRQTSQRSRPRFERPTAVGWSGMVEWLSGRAEDRHQDSLRREKTSGDQLYDAIRQYLLHDWQVPIIPQYARMTPPEIWALGARILDFHHADELAAYLDGGSSLQDHWAEDSPSIAMPPPVADLEPMPPPPPLPLPLALVSVPSEPVVGGASLPSAPLVSDHRARLGDVLAQDGRSIRMETMIPILLRPEIKAALGYPSQTELLQATRVLARTGAGTVRRLAIDFGLSSEQMAVMLTAAALMVPPAVFEKMFGRQGEVLLVLALVQKARSSGLGSDSSLVEFSTFIRSLLGRFAR